MTPRRPATGRRVLQKKFVPCPAAWIGEKEYDTTTGEGKPWVYMGRKRMNRSRVYRVWRWYNKLLDAGLHLGCDVGDERLLAVRS